MQPSALSPVHFELATRRPSWAPTLEKGIASVDFLRIVLSVIIPPVGVFMQVGFGMQFWLNILLTLLGYFPGLIHAIWVITSR